MISVTEVFQHCEDRINVETNGQLSLTMFNRFSKIGELRLMEWLTGDINAMIPPEPYLSQKNKDWLSTFITPKSFNVTNGEIPKPADYYRFESIVSLSGSIECGKSEEMVVSKNPITLLSSKDKFYSLVRTNIEELKPTIEDPIAYLGSNFEFYPTDIGSVILEYVRYPKYAKISVVTDVTLGIEVADEANSINYEWDEWAIEVLVFFIVDAFANRVREQALKQTNVLTNKTVRDSKQ